MKEYFKLPKELEEFMLKQEVSETPWDKVLIGSYRLERENTAPKGSYRLASDDILIAVKDYYKKKIKDSCWKDMFSCFFVNYNNGFEKTYVQFEIDKLYKNYNWRSFINNIETTRITGCTTTHFQRALQEAGIAFIMYPWMFDQKKYNEWMEVEWNKKNILTLEHSNIGNY